MTSGGYGIMERFYMWLSCYLPRKLVYWCAIRLMSFATVGEYSDTLVSELKAMDALLRWDKASEE